jgi:hypothetical protein
MHVQSVSHWAPANIGPYSQAVQVRKIKVFIESVYIAKSDTAQKKNISKGISKNALFLNYSVLSRERQRWL